MCGLVALWGDASAAIAQRMIDVIAHRGPDGAGVRATKGFPGVLAHRRLAIIDPEGGHQPLGSADGSWTLIANGMIYNDAELRRRYGQDRFLTGSDSEAILQAVMQDGQSAVADLDGMFAFVATDGQRLIAARDPIGIKPLYYAWRDGVLAFASEIKALLPFSPSICEFPSGHVYDSESGFRPFFRLAPPGRVHLDAPDAAAALRTTLEAAVAKRLRSDVPLGVFLSGGLDSSIIAALAQRLVGNIQTFAVGVENSGDILAARLMARHIGSTHHELIITPEMIDEALPTILYHLESFDQGLVRSAVPCFFVSGLAAEKVKVVLTGEGADELFAGYDYYQDILDPDDLDAELRASVNKMHAINLQRVDRMSMAHGLEARVPFLDRDMVALALGMPAGLKMHRETEIPTGKWILRRAFEDMVPPEIVWRSKVQFDQGSGIAAVLSNRFGEGHDRILCRDPALGRTKEEKHYLEVLGGCFENPGPVRELVAHWHPDYV